MAEEYRQHRFSRPRGATECLLVRHGESMGARVDQPFPLVNGHGDPPLHPAGVVQARRVAQRLATAPVAAVYVSNLQRTAQTAAPLCERLGVDPIVDADLREVYLGEWEGGLYRKRIAENDPIFREVRRQQRWDYIPGAESNEALADRVRLALNRIHSSHPDSLVVAVVHGGVIGSIVAMATQSSPLAFIGADNGSITHIVLYKGRIIVRRFNDTAHLGESWEDD